MLNGHGDDIYDYDGRIVSNFSSNIYNGLDLSLLDEHLTENISAIHSYPEPDALSLVKSISEKTNSSQDNICVTNGATEAIYLIAQVFAQNNSTIVIPTFSEYEDACRINKHNISFVSSLAQINEETNLVWLCNPNNPTGSICDKQYLTKFIIDHPQILFVIDQSYESFTYSGATFTVGEGLEYQNVIILHSMTKSYVIPGLRLGYVSACKDLIQKIKDISMPWSVNALAIEAGKFLLSNEVFTFDLKEYLSETKRFISELTTIEGLVVLPTSMHFFLCQLTHRNASELKKYLIDNYGILIRDASNFKGLDEHYFRLSTQSEEENRLLVKAIKEWI